MHEQAVLALLREIEFGRPREADERKMSVLCGLAPLQGDCSFCMTNEINLFRICKWCVSSAKCVATHEACGGAEVLAGVGAQACANTEMDWGYFDCSAQNNQHCAVCVNDKACAWCLEAKAGSEAWVPGLAGQIQKRSGFCLSKTAAHLSCGRAVTTFPRCSREKQAVKLRDATGAEDSRWTWVVVAVLLPFLGAVLFLIVSRKCLKCLSADEFEDYRTSRPRSSDERTK